MMTSLAAARAWDVRPAGPLLHQGFGSFRRAVVNRERVARLEEIGSHGVPHDAQAHKPDFLLHIVLLCLSATAAMGFINFGGAIREFLYLQDRLQLCLASLRAGR